MSRRRGAWLVLALALGCGDEPNTLEGSLSDQASLAFDSVRIERASSSIALLYLRDLPGGGGTDQVLKVTANAAGLDLDQALSIDLTERVGNQPRGALSRAVAGDGRRDFPPLIRGRLTFEQAPKVDAEVKGNFSVLFDFGSGQLGEGRTVFGNFKATVARPP